MGYVAALHLEKLSFEQPQPNGYGNEGRIAPRRWYLC